MPVMAMEKGIIVQCSVLDLQKSPLRRCTALANYVHILECRPQRNGNHEILSRFSKADIDALQIVNMALQNMSDENDLAVLRFCSARELRQASDIPQCANTTTQTASKNQRQSDYTLALQGYSIGERYAFNVADTEVQAWIRQLSEAGAEQSVSSSGWCTDDELTTGARICVLGQHPSSR